VQTQVDSKEPTLPSQTGNTVKYLTTNGTAKSWGTVSQYALPSQTGNAGKFLTTNGTSESWGTVAQPISWTPRFQPSSSIGAINVIEYNGSNLWVMATTSGLLYTSPDAITWTARTSQFGSNEIKSIVYANGLWVAVGGNSTISTSSDGITWTARTSNFAANQDINAVAYGNGVWVAVGQGGGTTNTGGITYSTDGITWTRKSQSLTIGASYYCVAWNGTNWIVGAGFSTNNYIYATTPSGTWTTGNSGSANIFKLFWDGTRMSIHRGNDFGYATGTTLATTGNFFGVPLIEVASRNNVYYYNNKLYGINGVQLQTITPTSGTNALVDAPISLPNRIIKDTPFVESSVYSIWAGAQGMIVGTTYGQIYTSF
jgi:hypothetical protein